MSRRSNRPPRIATIQNGYNLVDRTFEVDLAEVAMREQVGLLAYSPLAGGILDFIRRVFRNVDQLHGSAGRQGKPVDGLLGHDLQVLQKFFVRLFVVGCHERPGS